MTERLTMNVTEAAQALGVSRGTIYRLIHQSDFPVVRLGGRTLVSVDGLRRWIANLEGKHQPEG